MGMVKFLTIGYGDRDGYDRTSPEVRAAAHAHDQRLRDAGSLTGIAGAPVQVRNHDAAGLETTEGPYLSAPLPVAGFGLVDAPTRDDAVAMVAGTPCAVAQGVVEVWPLEQVPDPGAADGPVIVAGWLRVAPEDRAAYLDGCRTVIEAARRAPGCLDFHLSADPLDEGRINIHEHWTDSHAVESFRGAGPAADQQAAILDARVQQHRVAETTLLT